MRHHESHILRAYAVHPRTTPFEDAEAIEDHLLGCANCRSRIARHTAPEDVERSWTTIERKLAAGSSPLPASPDWHDHPTSDTSGTDTRRPIAVGLAAALLVSVIAGLAWASASRTETPTSEPPTVGWEVDRSTGAETLTATGEVLGIAALLEWRDGVLVVGTIQTTDGQHPVAWTSTAGGPWTEHILTFPTGCDPWGGLVVRESELLIACVRADMPSPILAVASTRDLEAWVLHDVGPVSSSFGVTLGSDGGRVVSVAISEPADPDTTMGARLRVWSTDDLVSWSERFGADEAVFVDATSQRIRIFGDDIVIAGTINTWPNGSRGPSEQVPAVWVSRAGAPFVAHVLTDESGDPQVGWVHDVTATSEGFVAVGGDGGRARAWSSADLDGWIPGVVIDPEPVRRSGGGVMWSVAADGENLVASSVGDPGGATPTWASFDGGRTWQPIGDGPSLLLDHGDVVVGVRTGRPVGLWRLDLS